MNGRIFLSLYLYFSLSTTSVASPYHYRDYVKIRDKFDEEASAIHEKVDKANHAFINSLNRYQQCSSNKWRVAFATVVPDVEERKNALDDFRKNACDRAGQQNSQMLKIADEHNISSVQADADISEFVSWYKNHVSMMKSDPLHDLETYSIGYEKLASIYEKMATACQENDANSASDFDLVASGIKGLLDSVFSLIGKAKSSTQ